MPSDSSDFDVGLIIPLSEEFGYVRDLLLPQRTIQRGGDFFFALRRRQMYREWWHSYWMRWVPCRLQL
jgi:hypothetical protein